MYINIYFIDFIYRARTTHHDIIIEIFPDGVIFSAALRPCDSH